MVTDFSLIYKCVNTTFFIKLHEKKFNLLCDMSVSHCEISVSHCEMDLNHRTKELMLLIKQTIIP